MASAPQSPDAHRVPGRMVLAYGAPAIGAGYMYLLLGLYVMKPSVPDQRYVGTLSPNVEEYVAHAVITNSWCVSAKWSLEPGDVYAIIAVMYEAFPSTNIRFSKFKY